MSSIVLSASVRQNLLSLQSTASLLATTQNDLATGNKVNSALDNPTSFFTAAALNNRASDISNLLDSIGNGVQVLQAANTGITSLQSLVASAQSVANQVLQTPVGYSTKSSVSTTAISGATANNLLGTGTGYTDATFAGATSTGTITAAFTSATSTGTSVSNDNSTACRHQHVHPAGRHRQQHLERPRRRRDHRWLHAGRRRQDHHLLDRDHDGLVGFVLDRLYHRYRHRQRPPPSRPS